MTNAYQVLGIRNFATQKEIRIAYRKMSKKYHPDLHRGDAFYGEKFKEILAAYETLSNIERRLELDSYLRQQHHEEVVRQQQERHNVENEAGLKKAVVNEADFQTTETVVEQSRVNIKKSQLKKAACVFVVFVLAGSIVYYGKNRLADSQKDGISWKNSFMSLVEPEELPDEKSNDDKRTDGDKLFSINATKDEVRKIQGEPSGVVKVSAVDQEIWYYDMSSVTFEYGRVSEYANIGGNLQITYFDAIKKRGQKSFSIGATRTDVLNAQGNPTSTMRIKPLNQEIWYYGESRIVFEKGKVSEYSDNAGNLLISYSGNLKDNIGRQ